ncbi:retroelement pol polyprotein [Lasius niger]|uniref:Retroelement pol polyprotein n=1 Tax=Lasius niger TaxID=67767 RepID=A0A0J7KRH5_LASNI|nr:retroelement pol polyprotein [Lasius niger]
MKEIMRNKGIEHETRVPYTPEQNGSTERDNRTIVEAARTMILAKGLDKRLWAEAVNAAVYTLNRTGTSSVQGKTPYEIWFGRLASNIKLRIFGTKTYTHIPKEKRKKWDQKAKAGILVGYGDSTKEYRIWFEERKKIEIHRNVVFANEKPGITKEKEISKEEEKVYLQEEEKVYLQEDQEANDDIIPENNNHDQRKLPDERNGTEKQQEENEEESKDQQQFQKPDNEVDEDEQEEKQQRYGLRDRQSLQAPVKFGDYIDYINVEELFIAEYQEPKTFNDAVRSDQAKQWKAAMKEEMDSLKKNETWKIVELPEEAKALENKWVYKLKTKADGSIDRYKARLLVKGFTQRPGIDYMETFSPVVKFTSIRAILAVAVAAGMNLFQFDIKTAFLNGNLEENIYMKQPEGFEDGSEKVCKLQ